MRAIEANPGDSVCLISSEAMEQAIRELEDRLPSESPAAEEEEVFSLDEAVAFLHKASLKE